MVVLGGLHLEGIIHGGDCFRILRYLESQLLDYVKTNGQNPMSFNLNMNNYKIENLKDTDSSTSATEAVNKKYVDD